MKTEYFLGIFITVLLIFGFSYAFSRPAPEPKDDSQAERYEEIVNPSDFVNTEGKAVTIGEYVGKKVILLDVMTYSCINCQRTFPYVTSWYEKYKDDGLIVIGIHTPEFAFEKVKENVEKAMKEFGINFPVVMDNDYSTWNAYGNRYWPRKYLIDIHGNIVYDHIGEGAYEETEEKIQELLKERAGFLGEAMSDLDGSLVSSNIQEKNIYSGSPETYFGSWRNEYLGNGKKFTDGTFTLSVPENIAKNKLYLGGEWEISKEYSQSVSDSKIVYKYDAKEVYIVAEAEEEIEMEAWQDGVLVGEIKGEDVDSSGVVRIKESRLYKIISNKEKGEHALELRIKKKGVKFFAFTFG